MTGKDKEPIPLPTRTDRMLDTLALIYPELAQDEEMRGEFRGYLKPPLTPLSHRAIYKKRPIKVGEASSRGLILSINRRSRKDQVLPFKSRTSPERDSK